MIRDWRTIEIKEKKRRNKGENNKRWIKTQALIDDSFLCGLKGCNRKITKIKSKPQFNILGIVFCSIKHYETYLEQHNIPIEQLLIAEC
ncbi:MAG: hypothetical protein ACXADY_20790 [Candidatus Hodarchaeales archaeon]